MTPRKAEQAIETTPGNPGRQARRRAHASIRNILYNELGFTKADLQTFFRDELRRIADRVLRDEIRIADLMEKEIKAQLRRHDLAKTLNIAVNDTVRGYVVGQLHDRLKININVATAPKSRAKAPTKGNHNARNHGKHQRVGG